MAGLSNMNDNVKFSFLKRTFLKIMLDFGEKTVIM